MNIPSVFLNDVTALAEEHKALRIVAMQRKLTREELSAMQRCEGGMISVFHNMADFIKQQSRQMEKQVIATYCDQAIRAIGGGQ